MFSLLGPDSEAQFSRKVVKWLVLPEIAFELLIRLEIQLGAIFRSKTTDTSILHAPRDHRFRNELPASAGREV